jgi:hypothetical protein
MEVRMKPAKPIKEVFCRQCGKISYFTASDSVLCWRCFMNIPDTSGQDPKKEIKPMEQREMTEITTQSESVKEAAPVVAPVAPVAAKPKTCATCGGPAYKRGYKHTETCPDSTVNKLAAKRKKL